MVAHPEDKIASVRAGDFLQAVDTDARILGCILGVENGFFPYRGVARFGICPANSGLAGGAANVLDRLLNMYYYKADKGEVR